MKLCLLTLDVRRYTGKIIKNRQKGENLLQNGILHFVFLSKKTELSEKAPPFFKGLFLRGRKKLYYGQNRAKTKRICSWDFPL